MLRALCILIGVLVVCESAQAQIFCRRPININVNVSTSSFRSSPQSFYSPPAFQSFNAQQFYSNGFRQSFQSQNSFYQQSQFQTLEQRYAPPVITFQSNFGTQVFQQPLFPRSDARAAVPRLTTPRTNGACAN